MDAILGRRRLLGSTKPSADCESPAFHGVPGASSRPRLALLPARPVFFEFEISLVVAQPRSKLHRPLYHLEILGKIFQTYVDFVLLKATVRLLSHRTLITMCQRIPDSGQPCDRRAGYILQDTTLF